MGEQFGFGGREGEAGTWCFDAFAVCCCGAVFFVVLVEEGGFGSGGVCGGDLGCEEGAVDCGESELKAFTCLLVLRVVSLCL